jgi:hypothetical protein
VDRETRCLASIAAKGESDVYTFILDELVWAMRREREEEARKVQPHTTPNADPERSVQQFRPVQPEPRWVAASLKAGSGRA